MAQILIVYGSTDGHTARVAEKIGTHLRGLGHAVALYQGDRVPQDIIVGNFDAYIVGASVHYGKFQPYIGTFIQKNLSLLQNKPSAFFAVSGASSSGALGRQEAKTFSTPFLEKLKWEPLRVEQIAGAFPFTRYAFWKRWMMQYIVRRAGGEAHARKDYAYTDWERVERFAVEFAALIAR
jgi:menaquinone-dependent protoporphyrinogen oxidase